MAANDIDMTALGGVWERTLLVTPDGRRDETSRVWWLQLGEICGDIRAPAGAASAETAFAGRLSRRDDAFRWTPEIARGSVTDGAPDEGRLSFDGDILREEGVHSPYVEHWRRVVPQGLGDRAVRFVVPGRAETGILMEIGPYAFCARPLAGSGAAFVLAERIAGFYMVHLAVGCPTLEGERIAWPRISGDIVTFPPGLIGPPAAFAAWPADRLIAVPEPAR